MFGGREGDESASELHNACASCPNKHPLSAPSAVCEQAEEHARRFRRLAFGRSSRVGSLHQRFVDVSLPHGTTNTSTRAAVHGSSVPSPWRGERSSHREHVIAAAVVISSPNALYMPPCLNSHSLHAWTPRAVLRRPRRPLCCRAVVSTPPSDVLRPSTSGESEPHGWSRAEWASGYVSLAENALDYEVTDVEGEIPSQLRGVYYRNGPGTFEAGSEMYAHPFDGDGLELSLSFLEVLAEET